MRLSYSKSKNTALFYIIKDYTKNGKSFTKIVKRIGNLNDVKTYNEEHCHSETVIIEKNNKKIIPMNISVSYNVGYLFLKSIYNKLKLNEICNSIQEKYQFQFDLYESSKLNNDFLITILSISCKNGYPYFK